MEDPMLYNIALTKVPNVGSKRARTLLSYCGSAQAVFEEPAKYLKRIPGFGPTQVHSFQQSASILKEAEKDLKSLEKKQIKPIFIADPEFPRRLRNIPDSPIMLYVKGEANLNPERALAIVGTRHATDYGRLITDQLIDALAPYNVTIISGLAYGIDVTAHKRALRANLPTIGVMGTGFSQIYPTAHKKVASQMLQDGALVSELSYHKGPDKEHFPMRNRIIAGMSDAVLVVESGIKGGSIITAELANSYDRDVFAIPGRVNDPQSVGCNQLIRFHRAYIARHAEDIVRSMNWDVQRKEATQAQLFIELSKQEQDIVELLRGKESAFVDDLSHEAGVTPGTMASFLLSLELKGVVKSLPGNRYLLI